MLLHWLQSVQSRIFKTLLLTLQFSSATGTPLSLSPTELHPITHIAFLLLCRPHLCARAAPRLVLSSTHTHTHTRNAGRSKSKTQNARIQACFLASPTIFFKAVSVLHAVISQPFLFVFFCRRLFSSLWFYTFVFYLLFQLFFQCKMALDVLKDGHEIQFIIMYYLFIFAPKPSSEWSQ